MDQRVWVIIVAEMNGESGRFVDDCEIFFFEENVEWKRLREGLDLLQRRLEKINLVAGSDNLPRPGGLLVEPNEPGPDQLLKARTRIFRKPFRQKPIKAQLGVVCRHDKLDRRRIFQGFGTRLEQEHEQE